MLFWFKYSTRVSRDLFHFGGSKEKRSIFSKSLLTSLVFIRFLSNQNRGLWFMGKKKQQRKRNLKKRTVKKERGVSADFMYKKGN